ncbi:MAG: PKD domain-containing protein [Acidimicrobiales bacterium]
MPSRQDKDSDRSSGDSSGTSGRSRGWRSWSKRALLAVLVGGVLFFGLRANGAVAERLATIDESVWLVNPPAGVLVRVNALAGDVTSAVKVAAPLQQLSGTQFGSGVIVLNRTTSALGRVDGSTLAYQPAATMVVTGTDLGLVGNDAAVFAVDTSDGRLVALDGADLSTRYETPVTANQSISTVVDAAGRLWAYDDTLGEVIRFDGVTGDVKRAVVDPSGSAGVLTLVQDAPVLINAQRGQAFRLNGDGSAGQQLCLGGSGDGPLFAAGSPATVDAGQLYVLSTATGDLWTTDVATNQCVSLQLRDEGKIGDAFGQPVAHGDRLFVPVMARAEVLVVNGADNSIERTIDLSVFVKPGNRFELFVDAGRLWFNDLDGSRAGVLSRLGPTLVVDKVQQRSFSGEQLSSPDRLNASLEGTTPLDDPFTPPVTSDNGEGGGTGATTGSPGREGPGSAGPGPGNRAGGRSTGAASGDAESGDSNAPTLIGPGAVGAGPDRKPTPSNPTNGSGDLQANFTYSPPGDPTTETRLSFVDTSVGDVIRWDWVFTAPDATTDAATGRTLTRALPQVGLWTVTLTVTDGEGNVDATRPLGIQVRDPADLAPPNANFTWDPATPVVRAPVQFRDRSTTGRNSPVTSWFWEFGDGSTSNSANPPLKAYASAGRYTVRLTVSNDEGVDTAEAALTVAAPPADITADFTFADAEGSQTITAGEVVSFTDLSTGGPTSWQWNFGDGSTASGDTVSHQFRFAGEYQVRLNVANSQDTAVVVKAVRVAPPLGPPVARIGEPANNAVVEVDRPVRFVSASTGNPTQEEWDWGDGTRSQGSSALKSFGQPGVVVVRLTASNVAGSTTDTLVVTVAEVAPPQLQPSFRTTTGTSAADLAVVGQPVRFVNTSSGAGTFSWSFGDGVTSQERDPSHVYSAVGTYHVTLTMSFGTTSMAAEGDVYVGPAPVPVVANFDWLPRAPRVGSPVQFTDRSTGTPSRWSWNFGDGSPDVLGQVPPTKVYNLPGRYDVTLTVVDGSSVSIKTLPVVVENAVRPRPLAVFTVTPSAAALQVAGRALVLTDATLGGGAALSTPEFTIEGIQVLPPAGSRSVEHIFDVAGTYPVSMRVCWADDPTNCGTETRSLVISAALVRPTAAFTVTGPGVVQGGDATVLLTAADIVLTDASTGGVPTGWAWTVGGVPYTGRTVTVRVASAGPVTISLTATNGALPSLPATRDFVAYTAPTAAFVAPASAAVGASVTFTDQSAPAPAIRTWTFGDTSAPVVGSGANQTHTYATAGVYQVTLTVHLGDRVHSLTRTITVLAPLPTPQITSTNLTTGVVSPAAIINVAAGDAVRFDDVSPGPAPVIRAWVWDDSGPAGAGATVSRTFATPGTYTLSLTSTIGTTSVTVSVVVNVTATPPPGVTGV